MKFYHWGCNIVQYINSNFCLMPIHHLFLMSHVKITNLIITWPANYISLIMLWLYDGILGIMCPWLVTFPLTFYRTLWKMLSILAATGVLRAALLWTLKDCRILLDNRCFPNFVYSRTLGDINRPSVKKKRSLNIHISLSNALRCPK